MGAVSLKLNLERHDTCYAIVYSLTKLAFDVLLNTVNHFHLKGVTDNTWQLNRECSIVENFFSIHLRHIKRLNDL